MHEVDGHPHRMRQAIWELLKSLGAHLLREGINLTKVSLPVKVFEPRSFLERVTDNFSYLGLLAAAADAPDPVLRMQYLVCCLAFIIFCPSDMLQHGSLHAWPAANMCNSHLVRSQWSPCQGYALPSRCACVMVGGACTCDRVLGFVPGTES